MYLMVTEPLLNQKELADRLGRHVVTVSQVQRSDIFKARLEKMRGEHEEEITQRVMARMDECIERGLARVGEALNADEVNPSFALDAVVQLDKRRRGEKTQTVNLHAHQHSIDPGVWERARAAVREHAVSEDLSDYVSSGEEPLERPALPAPGVD
jgi:hypothetical protein